MKKSARGIGLAIVGAGRVGIFRGEIAARHPAVEWIGLAEIVPERGKAVGERIGADFVTTDYRELLKRPEVNAVIIATEEELHVDPIMAACERGHAMLIEKPLATDLTESAQTLDAVENSGVDAVIGYTQRFRRRWLAASPSNCSAGRPTSTSRRPASGGPSCRRRSSWPRRATIA